MTRSRTAGVTLIEVLVSLAIFAVIGVAGYAMLDLVARTDRLTEGRLQRLGQMQRAMYLIDIDFHVAESMTVKGSVVTVRRVAPGAAGGVVSLNYALTGQGLHRQMLDVQGVVMAEQELLPGVTGLTWRFLGDDWSDNWPPEAVASAKAVAPRAVEVSLTLADGKTLRRVTTLPNSVP